MDGSSRSSDVNARLRRDGELAGSFSSAEGQVEDWVGLSSDMSAHDALDMLVDVPADTLVIISHEDTEAGPFVTTARDLVELLRDVDPDAVLADLSLWAAPIDSVDLDSVDLEAIVDGSAAGDDVHEAVRSARPRWLRRRQRQQQQAATRRTRRAARRHPPKMEAPPDPPDAAAPSGDPPTADPPREVATLHPWLHAPAAVAAREQFSVKVRVASQPQDGGDPLAQQPFLSPVDDGTITLDVTVAAPGFDLGTRQATLTTLADDPAGKSVTFRLTAPTVTEAFTGRIEAHFSAHGLPLGVASRPIVVAAGDGSDLPEPATSSQQLARAGAADIDLTVTVVPSGDSRARAEWVFTSPHEGVVPTDRVEHDLAPEVMEEFTHEVVRRFDTTTPAGMAARTVRGIGRRLSAELPSEFWEALQRVVDRVDGPPSVLVVSDLHELPWELAATESPWLRTTPVPDAPAMLGAQARLGRWPRGTRRPTHDNNGGDGEDGGRSDPGTATSTLVPPVPPTEHCAVADIVVVYDAREQYVEALPRAAEEADHLQQQFHATAMEPTVAAFTRLFHDQDHEVVAQAVHLAVHGTADVDIAYSGIVMTDDRDVRLKPVNVSGARVIARDHAFVFFNACQTAVGGGPFGVSDFGLQFAMDGASGFVGPLWRVDDEVARDLAIEFHERALREGVTVGEALRQSRAVSGGEAGDSRDDADADSQAEAGEAMARAEREIDRAAYVFWGHPDLQLDWEQP